MGLAPGDSRLDGVGGQLVGLDRDVTAPDQGRPGGWPGDRVSARTCLGRSITTSDGLALFYRVWLPRSPSGRALLLFHRGHEHSGRWQGVVDALGLDDVTVFALDARGHGRSPGQRGAAENVAALVRDVEDFASHVTGEYGIGRESMVVMAHSAGAVVATAWVHDYGPPIRGLILAAPAFRVRLHVPGALSLLRLGQAWGGPAFVRSYVGARLLTRDRAEVERYRRDPLLFRRIAVSLLLDLHDTSRRLLADAGAIHVPTLVLSAGSDLVVGLAAQRRFFRRLSSGVKAMHVYPGFRHALFHERERHRPIAAAREFVLARFAARPDLGLLDADARGYTRAEYDHLRAPGSRAWVPVRWALRTVGRLSDGVRLGWRTGFDSGLTLDYVYQNRPRGVTPLGRWIDRAFLRSLGWRGIRQRRVHLERALATAIRRLHAEGRSVHLLDVAAGPGRYVLETLRAVAPIPATALLRDASQDNLEAGRRLAVTMGLSGVAFVRGDALDRVSLAAVSPRPTLAVVSGLYELLSDNGPVLESLRGLADALEPGGFLVYTNQPWHPQVELIARVLTNRQGRPWVMRRRTQAEMDQLVRTAGFDKLSQAIDAWGIFTVSLARRRAA